MNMGIVTSFIVGGLLLLAMLQFNNRVLQNSTEVTMSINQKNHISNIRRVLSQDFNSMGFGNGSTITTFNPPHFIKFSADAYGKGNAQIIWQFQPNTQVNSTSNPDDRILRRTGQVNSSGTSAQTTFHVVDFSITGYSDVRGENETSDINQLKSLLVKIVYESPESISFRSDTTYYSRAVWRKHFVPNNLQLN